ncbi:unnamed protein product [Rotaria magnacalcarata]|uniref:Uncharacterized protein n=1 Tax=Rotaria magnacalcarata TaxID=392030 RepID=A0A816QV98_9BILA|nr:unnamed protein product [Rotaria magnacalcarata]CAF3777109.1 unnamed protein product [Rotaria magnacalcarata]
MSIVHHHQIFSSLLQDSVSHAMIKIVEEQRINEKDLQTMDRDDIEHLFKNENGFTFRDRKRFWAVIQNIQSSNKHNDVIYIDNKNVYELNHDETPNYTLSEQFTPFSSSNISTLARTYHDFQFETNIHTTIFGEQSSTNNVNHLRKIAASLPIYDRLIYGSQATASPYSELGTYGLSRVRVPILIIVTGKLEVSKLVCKKMYT